jgi:hypothetical protein
MQGSRQGLGGGDEDIDAEEWEEDEGLLEEELRAMGAARPVVGQVGFEDTQWALSPAARDVTAENERCWAAAWQGGSARRWLAGTAVRRALPRLSAHAGTKEQL